MAPVEQMTPFETAMELMRIPSVTGEEGAIGRHLAALLEADGYPVRMQPVSDGRANVIAGTGAERLVFCTHIDTVPPYFEPSEDDRTLFGRGACDTKGIIAAMLEAGRRLRAGGLDDFGFLFLVGEETGGDGAQAANTHDWQSEFVVVGEPTGNRLARAQKGVLMAEHETTGQAAHSGYPEAGRSAADPMIDVLHDCIRADWGSDPLLGQGTLNVGVIRAGERANILAPRANATIMLRAVEPPEVALGRLETVVNSRASITVQAASAPQYMHYVEGFPDTVVSFGSDVPYLGRLGRPLLVGPGSILDAHTAHEKMAKDEMLGGIDLYERLARTLLGAGT
jgi:acetylornithine deacetylase